MALKDPFGEEPPSGGAEPLIFVSDASAEAERLSGSLRTRGYPVVDVPLGLLVGRASVQCPAIVLCDADAPGALEVIERLREIPGGSSINVLFLGETGRALSEHGERLGRLGNLSFVRPVDLYAVQGAVESLIGAPPRRGTRLSTAPQASRAPVLVASSRRPYRYDTGARGASLAPPGSLPPPSSSPVNQRGPVILQTRLSPDLEALLGEADQRVAEARASARAPAERLSPEAELQALLPPELLEALDEPLDELDDEDDDREAARFTPGQGGSEAGSASRSGSRPAHDSSVGTSPGGSVNPFERRDVPTGTGEARRDSVPPEAEAPLLAEPSPPAEPPPPTAPGASRAGTGPPLSLATTAGPASQAWAETTRPPRAPAGPSAAVATATAPLPPLPPLPPRAVPHDAAISPLPRTLSAPVALSAVSEGDVEIPHTLLAGDALRVLARAVRARYSGAVAFEDNAGIRRVVFRDGDFVITATGLDSESLVTLLEQRGDLSADVAARLGRKLPQFGRHAGAALIAQGYLRQDDLWPVLRAHAEWLLTRIALLDRGAASLERQVPTRLLAEPSVFGGATGAEVLIDIARRAVPAADAAERLGGLSARLEQGPAEALLAECALSDEELALVRGVAGATLGELLEQAGSQELATLLYALTELGVLVARAGGGARRPRASRSADALDHEAARTRIRVRRALVDEGDYFSLLGVSRSATNYDVRRAYVALRKELDPANVLSPATADLNEDLEIVLESLDEAYEILRDQTRRERYRRALEDSP